MKKISSLFAGVVLAVTLNAQATPAPGTFTITYDFAEAPSPDPGTVEGDNVTSSSFIAVGLASTTTGNRFAWSDFPVSGAMDENKYFEVTITPAANYKMTITSITFAVQRSGTGPRTYVVRSSVDTFAANKPAAINNGNPELEILPNNQFHFTNDSSGKQVGSSIVPIKIIDITAPVKLRFYAYDAEASGGTFSIDDVVISGKLESVLATDESALARANFVKNTVVANNILFGAKSNIQIVNMNGQVVKSASVNDGTSLDVASLPKGMYIVTGTVDGKPVSQKIMKK